MRHFKKPLGICLLLLSLLPLIWGGLRIKEAAGRNGQIQSALYPEGLPAFQYSPMRNINIDKKGYQAGVPVKEMADRLWRDYMHIFYQESGCWTLECMELPVSLTYYAEPSFHSEKVLQLEKGERVIIVPEPEEGYFERGYGFLSLPDYKEGWRCVKPFMKTGSGETVESLPYYYIPLSELEAVLDIYIRQTAKQKGNYLEKYIPARAEQIEKGSEAEKTEAVYKELLYNELLFADIMLYADGIHPSPDLQGAPLWDTTETLLACGFGVLLLSGAVLLLWGRKRASPSKEAS